MRSTAWRLGAGITTARRLGAGITVAWRPSVGITALMLLLYAVAIELRMPDIVETGRFWAEEGTTFFAAAWTRSPVDALLTPVAGYLNIAATGSTVAARWLLPLEFAPYLTIAAGLVCQLLPPLILLRARDRWLQEWRIRIGGVLLLLFVPAADELWLQSLHCQFELALCAGLLLAFEVPVGAMAGVSLGILVLGPLCGPGAIALLPLFAVRAALDRTPGRVLQCAALASGSAIQLLLFFSVTGERAYVTDPAVLLSVVTVKHVVVPWFGITVARGAANMLRDTLAAGQFPFLALAAPAAFALLLGLILWRRNWTALWLVAGCVVAAGSAYVGALDGARALVHEFAGERYAFVPQSLLAFALLALAGQHRDRVAGFAAVLCLGLVVVGIQQFRRPWPAIAHGPAWRTEVAAWRADPAHVLQLWPPGWTMRLDPEAATR